MSKSTSVSSGLDAVRDRSPKKESIPGFSMLGVPMFPMLPSTYVVRSSVQDCARIFVFIVMFFHSKYLNEACHHFLVWFAKVVLVFLFFFQSFETIHNVCMAKHMQLMHLMFFSARFNNFSPAFSPTFVCFISLRFWFCLTVCCSLARLADSIRKVLAQEARTVSSFAKKSKHIKNMQKKGNLLNVFCTITFALPCTVHAVNKTRNIAWFHLLSTLTFWRRRFLFQKVPFCLLDACCCSTKNNTARKFASLDPLLCFSDRCVLSNHSSYQSILVLR